MNNDKSAAETSKEFANRSGRTIEFLEKSHSSSTLYRVTYHQTTLYISNDNKESRYFVCKMIDKNSPHFMVLFIGQ